MTSSLHLSLSLSLSLSHHHLLLFFSLPFLQGRSFSSHFSLFVVDRAEHATVGGQCTNAPLYICRHTFIWMTIPHRHARIENLLEFFHPQTLEFSRMIRTNLASHARKLTTTKSPSLSLRCLCHQQCPPAPIPHAPKI